LDVVTPLAMAEVADTDAPVSRTSGSDSKAATVGHLRMLLRICSPLPLVCWRRPCVFRHGKAATDVPDDAGDWAAAAMQQPFACGMPAMQVNHFDGGEGQRP